MAAPALHLPSLLPPHLLPALARHWLAEDSPTFDPTHALLGPAPRRAQLLAHSRGILAGLPLAEAALGVAGCHVSWRLPEGSSIGAPRKCVGEVTGPGSALLLAERVTLNLLGRCSGVATAANQALEAARAVQWEGRVAGTRKTTPGFRLAEKYALRVGGADPHRHVLGGGALVLLKDTHLAALGGALEEVVRAARRAGGFSHLLGVECGSREEALRAAAAGADIVLLDNFQPQELHATAGLVKASHPRVVVEASGGINLKNLPLFLGPHVDVVSMGCLTQDAPALDFSMKVLGPQEEGTC